MLAPWKKSYGQPSKHIKKQRHYFETDLPTKVHLVKAMVFPVVMYGCERWTIKTAECQRICSQWDCRCMKSIFYITAKQICFLCFLFLYSSWKFLKILQCPPLPMASSSTPLHVTRPELTHAVLSNHNNKCWV